MASLLLTVQPRRIAPARGVAYLHVGVKVLHDGEPAKFVRVIGWCNQRGSTGPHGTGRVDGVIVNLHLSRARKFLGDVCLPHSFCRWQLVKPVEGQVA